MAVVHPVDAESLSGALLARDEGLIVPILVGPEDKIRALAEQEGLDLDGCSIVDVPHFRRRGRDRGCTGRARRSRR